jgi:hypothetical protein
MDERSFPKREIAGSTPVGATSWERDASVLRRSLDVRTTRVEPKDHGYQW